MSDHANSMGLTRMPARYGWLMCPLHQTWMVPPDAEHEGHPEFDGQGCHLVDPFKVLEFLNSWWLQGGGMTDEYRT